MIIFKGNAYSFSDLFPDITVMELIGIRDALTLMIHP